MEIRETKILYLLDASSCRIEVWGVVGASIHFSIIFSEDIAHQLCIKAKIQIESKPDVMDSLNFAFVSNYIPRSRIFVSSIHRFWHLEIWAGMSESGCLTVRAGVQ